MYSYPNICKFFVCQVDKDVKTQKGKKYGL